jgi:alpha-galactosidase
LAQEALDLPETPKRDDIRVNVSGINHFTWIDQADFQGHDLLSIVRRHLEKPGILRVFTQEEVENNGGWFQDHHQIKLELFRRYGVLAAAGDRHLSEFVPGFTHSPEELFRWGIIVHQSPASNAGKMRGIVKDYLEGRLIWTPQILVKRLRQPAFGWRIS